MKKQNIERKLEYLYERLGGLEDFISTSVQIRYLENEIDYYRTELLKIEIEEHFKSIDDEDN